MRSCGVGCRTARLADVDAARAGAGHLEHLGRHQPVVHDDVGRLQPLQRLERQKLRVAGTGAHDVHHALGASGA